MKKFLLRFSRKHLLTLSQNIGYFCNYLHRAQCRNMKSQIAEYVKNHPTERKLHIGAGCNVLHGWLNTDYSGPIYLDAGLPFLIEDNSFDYIFSEHMFEHLTLKQAENMLRESYRILKPGGVLRIATPDYQFLINLYNNPTHDVNQRYMEWSNGKYVRSNKVEPLFVVNNFHTSWGHKVVYDYDTLARLVESCGFEAKQCEVGQSEHKALLGVEKHADTIPLEFNLLETMVLEATKA